MGRLKFVWRGGAFPWLVILMLGLGVGATTAMFSVVHGVLFQPLPFHDPGQLVLVGERAPQIPNSDKFAFFDTPSAFFAWRRSATDFSGLAAIQSSSFTLIHGGRPQVLHGAKVSGNFFDILEVQPQLGRLLTAADEADPTRPVVITDQLWRSAFNADPAVIGRSMGASGPQMRVIGVLPADFRFQGGELGPMAAGEPTQYFYGLNLRALSGESLNDVWSDFNYTVIGRLRPGVTLASASAQLDVVQAQLAANAPDKSPGLHLYGQIEPVLDYATANARQELWLMMGGVAAVLLIICVNLGGLWTSRIADQRRNWAIRAALGAAPARLARQVLFESAVLSLLGGLLGLAAAVAGLQGLLALAPAGIPRLDEVHMDWRVLLFGFALALIAGLITGLVPALRLLHTDPQQSLKASGSSATADRESLRSRQVLIAVQAALSTLLLAGGGLLGLSFYRLMTRPAGFNAAQALSASVVINTYKDAQRDAILRHIRAAVAAVPGVEQVGFTSHLPLQGETWIDGAGKPGKTYPSGQGPLVNVRFISPDYLSAIGIPLLAGRDFRESDKPAGWPPKSEAQNRTLPHPVILSRAAARLIFPGTDPRTLVGQPVDMNDDAATIVGVSADALDGSLTTAAPAVVYQPYWEYDPYTFALVVRTPLSAAALAAPIRAAIWKIAPDAPIPALQPLTALRDQAVAPERYQMTLLLLFALLALMLAGLGVYALVSHSALRRAKEFAIRRSLGAADGQLSGLILRQALAPVIAGVFAGLLLALAGSSLLQALLFEVSPTSPLVMGVVAVAVLVAALAACVLPARRALRADPWSALRTE